MAILNAVHFGIFTQTSLNEVYGINAAPTTAGGKTYINTGASAGVFTTGTGWVQNPSDPVFLYEGYISINNLNEVNLQFMASNGAGQIAVGTDASGHIKWGRSGSLTSGTSTETVVIDTWYWVQIRFYLHATLGEIRILIDGTEYINDTNVNTLNFFDNIGQVRFTYCKFGECYWGDTTGSDFNDLNTSRMQISLLAPNGAGNSTDFTPSAGSNYECVDEQPTSETDYNSSSTDGHKDTFAMEDTSESGDVFCVIPFAIFESEDASAATVAAVGRHSSSESAGTPVSASNSNLNIAQVYLHNNPSTVAAWTTSEVDAMEAGYSLAV